jgi:hypothetical protein
MDKLTQPKPESQADAVAPDVVRERVQSGLPWGTEALGDVFPCASMPLCGVECGVFPASRIIEVSRGLRDCPLNRPKGCPYGKTPAV